MSIQGGLDEQIDQREGRLRLRQKTNTAGVRRNNWHILWRGEEFFQPYQGENGVWEQEGWRH